MLASRAFESRMLLRYIQRTSILKSGTMTIRLVFCVIGMRERSVCVYAIVISVRITVMSLCHPPARTTEACKNDSGKKEHTMKRKMYRWL